MHIACHHMCSVPIMLALRWFKLVGNLFTTAVSVLLLVSWYMPNLWSISTALAAHFGYDRSNEVLITVIYNLLDSGKDLLLDLPFSLYGTFVVEQRHGFNKQTIGLFIKDLLISVSANIHVCMHACKCADQLSCQGSLAIIQLCMHWVPLI